MPLLSLPKTTRDFDALKAEMVARIPQLAPLWTNMNEGDLGMVLVNLLAGVGDMLAYAQDRHLDEAFLPTATTREAVRRLTALIDYRLARPTAAVTRLRFTLPAPVVGAPVRIPRFTQVKTAAGGYFTTKEEVVLYAGQSAVEVDGYEGKFWQDSFVGTGADLQTLRLSHANAAQNFLIVQVGPQVWAEDTFENPLFVSTSYEVQTDENEVATVRFSRSLGDVPAQNTTVVVQYVATSGGTGNIGAGLVNSIVSLGDGSVAPTGLTVTNTISAAGGADREDIEHARAAAPRQLRAGNRAVTLQDHVDLLTNFPGVAKAQAINHNGYAELYVAPEGGTALYLTAPAVAVAVAPTGGTHGPGTYQFRVTAADAYGETTAAEYHPADRTVVDQTQTVTVGAGTTTSFTLTITPVPGAVRYSVWVSHDGGATWRRERTGAETTVTLATTGVVAAEPFPTMNTTGVRAASASKSLRQALEEHLDARRLIGTVFALFNPEYVPVPVTATLILYNNFLQSAVQGAVQTALQEYFAFTNQSFATEVPLSDLYAVVMGVPGVRAVSFAAPSGDVPIGNGQLARLGTLTLTATGGVLG